jgi:hypothetical protein
MVKSTVITDLGSLAYDDPHAVIDKKAVPDAGPGVNFDAGGHAAQMGNKTGK